MKPRHWIFIALGVLVLLGIAAFFGIRSAMVETEERVYIGFQGQARLNPFLAAERVLERLEISARSRPGFPDPSTLIRTDDPTDCLVAPLDSLPDKPRPVQSLKEWLSRGGILVTGLTGGLRSQPPVLAPELKQLLGVQGFENSRKILNKRPSPSAQDTDPEAETSDKTDPKEGAEKKKKEKKKPSEEDAEEEFDEAFESLYEREISLHLPWEDLATKVTARTTWRIKPTPDSLSLEVTPALSAFATAHEVGDGWVVVLSDLDLLASKHLPHGAHATFLHQLTGEASDVTFVYGWDSPSLSSYLWDEQRPALAALLALLVVGLAAAARRFGPIQPAPQARRRELLEHIRAAGLNLFRHAGRGSLALAFRKRIRARALLIHPVWATLGEEELARELARYAGFDAQRVVRAMTAPVTSREDLVEVFATLHLLRQSLGPTR